MTSRTAPVVLPSLVGSHSRVTPDRKWKEEVERGSGNGRRGETDTTSSSYVTPDFADGVVSK